MVIHLGESLSIVIPTINEVAGIAGTIDKIRVDALRKSGYDVEVLVVDGGSRDGTVEMARKFGARVVTERRPGYGRAYKTAFCHAKGDMIITLDGDGSYPAELIPKLVRYLSASGLDFITTSRFSSSRPTNMRLVNRLGNWILSLTSRVLFNTKFKDSQSGMWVFRKKNLKDILPNSDGMPFSEEIKVRASLNLDGVVEVAVPYRARIGVAKLKIFRDGLRNLLHLFRLFVTAGVRKRSNR